MGRVLRAYDPKLQREVALKEVSSRALGGAGSERLAEARAMAKLSHPNVVAVYDVEEIDADRLVIVMEYVTGQTLAGWRRDSPRGWEDILSRFRLAGRGLAAAHAAGVLHRDFKPSNVLVGPDGVVKVTDFGLAKLASARLDDEMQEPGAWTEAAPDDDDSRAPTGDRFVVGTPRYMAPEQHAGLRLTPAVDQYALCIALWEALCERASRVPGSRMPSSVDRPHGRAMWSCRDRWSRPSCAGWIPIPTGAGRAWTPFSMRSPTIPPVDAGEVWPPSRRR
jgi:serine/threonine protein kinase